MRKSLFNSCVLGAALMMASTTHAQRKMTIDELFNQLEAGSKVISSQKAGMETANAALQVARAQRLPDVNASLSATYNGNVLMTDRNLSNAKGITQPHIGNSFALEAQQVVYAGGAVNAGIKLAEVQKLQAENAVDITRQQQRFMALGQYLDLFKMDNSIKVYDSNIALTKQLIANANEKLKQGMALKNDVTRYELQLEALQLGKRKLEDQRDIINYQLCNTLGLPQQQLAADENVATAATDNTTQAAWQERAQATSPQLKQSQLGIDAAKVQLKLSKSDLLPKVAVFAADNFSGPFVYDLPPIDKNFNLWYIGIGVKYSLSSLFKGNRNVKRAEAVLRQTEQGRAVAVQQVDNQVQQAYTLYQQSFVDLRTQQKSVELATQNYEVVNNRYLNQLALVTDMVDAANVKLNAELQEVNARVNTVYAYYQMKFASGNI